jgi:hypothetical protein
VANDLLFFDLTTGLVNTNDLPANTFFNGLTFNSTAGAFTLNGNAVNLNGGITNASAVLARVGGLSVGATTGVAIGLIHAGTNGLRAIRNPQATELNWKQLAMQGAAYGAAGSILGVASTNLFDPHGFIAISSAHAQPMMDKSFSLPPPSSPPTIGGVLFAPPQLSSPPVAPIQSVSVGSQPTTTDFSQITTQQSMNLQSAGHPQSDWRSGDPCRHHVVRHHHRHHHLVHAKREPRPIVEIIIVDRPVYPLPPPPPMIVVPIVPPPHAVLPPLHVDPCATGDCLPSCETSSQLENRDMPVSYSDMPQDAGIPLDTGMPVSPGIPLEVSSSTMPLSQAAVVDAGLPQEVQTAVNTGAPADAATVLNIQGPCANPNVNCVEHIAFNDEGEATNAVLEPQSTLRDAGWTRAAQDVALNTGAPDQARVVDMPFAHVLAAPGLA